MDYKPTRSKVIIQHTRDAIDATNLTVRRFAMAVVERYHNTVAPDERTIKFNENPDISIRVRNWAQDISRIMGNDSGMRMPCDLEESWVAVLPEPYRSNCNAELARRMGMLPTPVLDINPRGAVGDLSRTVKEFSELLAVLGEATADNVINHKDRPLAKRALKESADVQGQIVAWQQLFIALLDDETPQLRQIK